MSPAEIVFIGIALSMDAVAVGMTNGMEEPGMRMRKVVLIALFYGAFQFLMPVLGYYGGAPLSSFIAKIPWLSFLLLAFLGGKMIADGLPRPERTLLNVRRPLGLGKLLAQAVATSVDALAVGVSFLSEELNGGLPFPAFFCALVIGGVTFLLSFAAVLFGRSAGARLSRFSEPVGGVILLAVAVKLLLGGAG